MAQVLDEEYIFNGPVNLNGMLRVNGYSFLRSLTSVGANSQVTAALTLTESNLGDFVLPSFSVQLPAGLLLKVEALDKQVQLTWVNVTAGSLNAPVGILRIILIKP